MKEIFDPNFHILHAPIFRRALPVRCELAGGLTPAFFLQTKKGARVLPFSAAGGMPSAMLAGLSDRLPHRRFVRFFSL